MDPKIWEVVPKDVKELKDGNLSIALRLCKNTFGISGFVTLPFLTKKQ